MAQFTRRFPRIRGQIKKGWVRLPQSWTQLRRRGGRWHKRHEGGTLCGKPVPEQVAESDRLPLGDKPCKRCVQVMNRTENDPDRKLYRHDRYQQQRQRLKEYRQQRDAGNAEAASEGEPSA